MGLVARAVEAAGVATVALSIVRQITEKTPPPRALFLRFPFGHALGEPGNRNQHLEILRRAFEVLFTAPGPGTLVDAGLRWRRETYPEPDWEAWRRLGG
ncbi:reductase [Deferrisoma palaeochoriense]